ncbi:hypothetical protein EFK50_19905 [Nocardioides marmoriginsengisoli]|uniref:Lipoprotein n=1 Tax=Nocardioides marmoriginsengisoli TaxID=661483 RepID=A0A3N0CC83_9ACTN|nr:hypothetical protein [Nocardioides marmoriginsengisoli]RNL60583.1 hypothetical protein EFK50_19905 [Nocardioides marmoriginsengisoli]
MRTKRLAIAACALACAAFAAGCGSDEPASLRADAPVFQGLDGKVVAEVLANPDASRKIAEEETDSARDSMAQGIVINFVTCREVAAAYRSWLTTGVRPELAPVPAVRSPQEPSYTDARGIREHLVARILSGDPSQLRAYLEGPSSCGHWIPAVPGDVSGPTIEDSLKEVQ